MQATNILAPAPRIPGDRFRMLMINTQRVLEGVYIGPSSHGDGWIMIRADGASLPWDFPLDVGFFVE